MEQDRDNGEQLGRLYREAIKRHAADPVGYKQVIDATHQHEEYNALCGDRIEVALRVHDEHVEAAAFDGEACAICLASASLLCSLAPGETVLRVVSMGSELQRALQESRMNPLLQGDEALRESRMNPLLQRDEAPRESRMNPLPRLRLSPQRSPGRGAGR